MNVELQGRELQPDSGLDNLVQRGAGGVTPISDDLRTHIAVMASAATRHHRTWSRRKRALAVATLIPVFVATGGGVAFAAKTFDWSWFWNDNVTTWTGWAENPDATIHYRLPGGGTCELRLGNFAFAPSTGSYGPDEAARVTAAAIDYVSSGQALKDADIAGVIEKNHTDQNWADDGDGHQVPFGYGTPNYNADAEYDSAVGEGLQEAITAHLDELGLPPSVSYQGQKDCTGDSE